MTTLYATDLDRTLIFSARAAAGGGGTPGLPEGEPAEVPADLVAVERYEGRDISFVSPRQLELLRALERRCLVVPVTTRTRHQYERVTVWAEPPAWAVAANGGLLLHQGEPDGRWTATVQDRIAAACRPLPPVAAWLADVGAGWLDRVRVADDLFLVALVDPARRPGPALRAELAERLSGWGWALSLQGRKLYAVPGPLTKSSAVAEVARREGVGTVIAAGDSLLDRDLLDAADVSLRPAHGELHEAGAPADVVTAATGLAAGEELLEVVLERVSGAAGGTPEGDEGSAEAGGRVPPAERARATRVPPA